MQGPVSASTSSSHPHETHRRSGALGALTVLVAVALAALPARGQEQSELQAGPYERLVIRGARVIPGHGGPAYGPADIVVEGDTITRIVTLDPVTREVPGGGARPDGDRVVEARGMTVMPGLVDLHAHIRTEPLPLEYVYYLKLAHGVTTMVNGAGRGLTGAMEQARLSDAGEIVAPRMYPIRDWGPARSRDPGHGPPLEEIEPWHDPDRAPELARRLIGEGAHVIRVGPLAWHPALFAAVCQAVREAGGVTTVHLPPSDTNMVDAVTAAEAGVTFVEHHYGYGEAAVPGGVQDFPDGYNYNDELDRFRQAGKVWLEADPERLFGEVVDRLVASGVTMATTMVVYEANRDINRAMGLPWHEKYSHRQLIEWFVPGHEYHGAYHWDWTSDDEATWARAYERWQRLIYEFNERGGKVGHAADDPYIWGTSGISNVRELQLLQETGMHPLEVIQAATRTSAQAIRRPDLGLVQVGYKADLAVVDGDPLHNLRFLYAFGAVTENAAGEMIRRGGVRWTIKDGVVFDNAGLIAEVRRMVDESKRDWDNPVEKLMAPIHRDGR